jgi:hypothetical protein
MRFVLIKVQELMGLTGVVRFSKEPILIYGRNLAGKTNLVNLVRYCFVFGRSKKSYSEEKRLQQDELLLPRTKEGSAVFYFVHRNKFYKLEYNFRRNNRKVVQKVYLFETSIPDSFDDEIERWFATILPSAANITKVKEEFNEAGIYSDIIDTLISPSNIRNFTDAINNEMVTIPDMIAKRVSSLNKGAVKILGNLEKLQAVLVQEKENCQFKLNQMKSEFTVVSSLEPQVVETMFKPGSIVKEMSEKLKSTEDELTRIPKREIGMELLKQKWAPEFKAKLEKYSHAKELSQKESEAVKVFADRDNQMKAWEIVKSMQSSFKNLPSGENILALLDFDAPSVRELDFDLLYDPDRIKEISQLLGRGRKSLSRAVGVAKAYKVTPSLSEVRSLAASYKKLERAIKSPEDRPKGTEAVVVYSEDEKLSSVFIPLDSLIDNPNFIRGMNETPSVYKSKGLGTARLGRISTEIKRKAEDLERCRTDLKSATEDVMSIKKLLLSIDTEERILHSKTDQADRTLRSAISDWEKLYSELKTTFGVQLATYELDTIKGIRKFIASLVPTVDEIESKLVDELKATLATAGVAMPRKLGLGSFGSIDDLVAKETEELVSKKERLSKTKGWIASNNEKLKEVEDMLVTIHNMEAAVSVLGALLAKVQENTNLNILVDQVARTIEENVRNCVEMIVPEEIVTFRHIGEGSFIVQTPEGNPITHPAGSHKAVISLGVMLTLSKLFDLPLFLDEATDRFDYVTLPNTFRFIDSLCRDSNGPQVCFVSYRTLNIERNQEIVDLIKNWKVYLVERKEKLEKQIRMVSDLHEIVP